VLVIGHLISKTDVPNNDWIARILDINGNDLAVRVSCDAGEQYEERWDKSETEAGLSNKEFYIIGKCHDTSNS